MYGFADGPAHADCTTSLDDIIGWNAFYAAGGYCFSVGLLIEWVR